MTAGNEKSGKKLVWEPPQLMRLTGPADAEATCIGGSGATEYCEPAGSAPQGGYCVAGSNAQWVCSANGSSAHNNRCLGLGSSVTA